MPSIVPETASLRRPPRWQMLKWIGNKQRSAAAIAAYLPQTYRTYYEPFLGGGALLGTMAPARGVAGDNMATLIELWTMIRNQPERVLDYYTREWTRYARDRRGVYTEILARYNAAPSGLDLLFLCRTCYGGVVRFTKAGQMSTPLGVHLAVPPAALAERLAIWTPRLQGTTFRTASYEETIASAGPDDLIYCDPPYSFSQAILYGAQSFAVEQMWRELAAAKERGAKIAVSIDGSKHSGDSQFAHAWPTGLFAREIFLELGGSMLKRFQLADGDTAAHRVSDRLLLSW